MCTQVCAAKSIMRSTDSGVVSASRTTHRARSSSLGMMDVLSRRRARRYSCRDRSRIAIVRGIPAPSRKRSIKERQLRDWAPSCANLTLDCRSSTKQKSPSRNEKGSLEYLPLRGYPAFLGLDFLPASLLLVSALVFADLAGFSFGPLPGLAFFSRAGWSSAAASALGLALPRRPFAGLSWGSG